MDEVMNEGMNEVFYDEFDQDEAEDDEIGDVAKGDGFADMMAKILNQKTGDKIPVLAKRKTTLMKEVEGSHIDSDRLKRQRAAKKVEKEKQLVVPDLSSADFERQLRKLATRGVVALFNAIAKTKKEAVEKEAAEKSEHKREAAEVQINRGDVKQMTHENFLAMLKGQKEDVKVMEEFDAKTQKSKLLSSSDRKSSTQDKAVERSSGNSSSGASGAAGGITWNALLDEYPLAGQSMALKDWDKGDDDDESGDDDNDGVKPEDGISDIREGGLRMTSSAEMEILQQKKQTAARKKK